MTPEHHDILTRAFLEARDMDSDERRAVIERITSVEANLGSRLERMLEKHDQSAAADARTSGAWTPRWSLLGADEDAAPDRIGPYEIIEEIGRGGMGIVYRARQSHPQRDVALKVQRTGGMSTLGRRRFEFEIEALGRLRHPGIAPLFEAGLMQVGDRTTPWFAMELIDGAPLIEYIESHQPGTEARVGLILRICDAVAYAHRRGIIHRDLKPANVLMAEDDQSIAQPRILDFGVARLVDPGDDRVTMRTEAGQIIGTVAYMSPEQLNADPDAIDQRSDVYSLGAMMFETLSGELPYDIRGRGPADAIRVIATTEALRLRGVRPDLPRDLDAITARAMAEDPDARYQSVDALQRDLGRWLRGEPVEAHSRSRLYLLRKFTARNKVLVGGVCATLLALTAGLIATLVLADAEREQRARAEARAQELEITTAFQSRMLSELDPEAMGRTILEGMRAAQAIEPDRVSAEHASMTGPEATDIALAVLDEHLLARVAATIDEEFSDLPDIGSALRQDLADLYRNFGLLERALEEGRRTLEVRRERYGEDDPRTLESLSGLALTEHALGAFDEAERHHRLALSGRERVLGMQHRDTLTSCNHLGYLMRSRGRYDEARVLYERALVGLREALGERHRETIRTMNNIALLYKTQGDLPGAESMYRRALDAAREALGEVDRLTLSLTANLGVCIEQLGRGEEAIAYYDAALRGRREVLGSDHPETVTSLNNMGYLLRSLGRLKDAEPYSREAYARRLRLLGPDHPATINSQFNVGSCLQLQGRLDEAYPIQAEAAERARRVRGETHRITLIMESGLATTLHSMGQQREANALWSSVLERARRGLANHELLGRFLHDYAECLIREQRLPEARSLLVESVSILRGALGPDNSRTRSAENLLLEIGREGSE